MKNVLIADDEPEILEIYSSLLDDIPGLKIIKACDGAEAYTKSRNQLFDLIITDYRMPKLNGVQLIAGLRANPLNANTPIYVITGYSEEVVKELNKEKIKGKITVLEKPISFDFLRSLGVNLTKENIADGKNSYSIDVDFVNPFIESVSSTLKQFARMQKISSSKPYLYKSDLNLRVDISSNLAVVSEHFTGTLLLGFPKETYIKIATEILNFPQVEIDLNNKGLAGELANIIFFKCKTIWDEKGFTFKKAVPSIIEGEQHILHAGVEAPTIVVPFHSEFGDIFTLISFAKN
jgi:CheY-like chemotaxis protein